MCFVLEFLEGGTIYTQVRFGPLDEDRARFYAACMLSGIAHLHSLDIAHKYEFVNASRALGDV